eukprot:6798988-Prymnesium_polylepis.3
MAYRSASAPDTPIREKAPPVWPSMTSPTMPSFSRNGVRPPEMEMGAGLAASVEVERRHLHWTPTSMLRPSASLSVGIKHEARSAVSLPQFWRARASTSSCSSSKENIELSASRGGFAW